MLSVLIKIFSHASAKNKKKKAEGFQISQFYWSFSSDNLAVKGLMRGDLARERAGHKTVAQFRFCCKRLGKQVP